MDSNNQQSGRYQWDDLAMTDIERQAIPLKRADSDNAATFQAPFRLEKYTKYGTAFADVSRRAHSASAPLFIPDFTGVRRQIVEHLNDSIHDLEAKLSTASDKETRNEYILEAVKLLECMDSVIKSEMRQARLQDPSYATSQGLNVLHFDMLDRKHEKLRPWLMVNKNWGEQSRTVEEPVDDVMLKRFLPNHWQEKLKMHGQVDNVKDLHPWLLRPKTVSEQQKWTLRYDSDGTVNYHSKINLAWNMAFLGIILILFVFYGVGIIATSSRFSETFQKYFYWIAIFWSLISSGLLSWLTVKFGASRRDAVGAFMTGLGLWLVIVQIGQTYLLGQVAEKNGGLNR